MRRHLILVLLITCFFGASTTSFGQDETKASLEGQVAILTAELGKLRTEVTESRAQIDEMLAYFQRNQRAAADLNQALAASESAGFTFGINPKSREILLAGWRKQLSAVQKDVPGAAPKIKVVPDNGRGRSFRR